MSFEDPADRYRDPYDSGSYGMDNLPHLSARSFWAGVTVSTKRFHVRSLRLRGGPSTLSCTARFLSTPWPHMVVAPLLSLTLLGAPLSLPIRASYGSLTLSSPGRENQLRGSSVNTHLASRSKSC